MFGAPTFDPALRARGLALLCDEPAAEGRTRREDDSALAQALLARLVPDRSEHRPLRAEALRVLLAGEAPASEAAQDLERALTRARRTNDYAIDLAALDHGALALAAATEAVALTRRLLAPPPATPLPGARGATDHDTSDPRSRPGLRHGILTPDPLRALLCNALNNLGCRLAEVGELERAIAVTREAAEIARAQLLGLPSPAALRAANERLADALTNLGNHLTQDRQIEEAIELAAEAVTVLRHADPASSDGPGGSRGPSPKLARALMNLGASLGDLDRFDEALAPTQEAAALYRSLARSGDPEAPLERGHALGLRTSLSNQGMNFMALARLDDAHETLTEAAAVGRDLLDATGTSRDDPQDLARIFATLGRCQHQRGEIGAAVAAWREAVALWRPLAQADPERFLPNLAPAQVRLADALSQADLGRGPAPEAFGEAVASYRALASRDPDWLPKLAQTLDDLAIARTQMGAVDEALVASMEAVEILRQLVSRGALQDAPPEDHRRALANTLTNLARDLDALHRPREAIAALEEACSLLRALASDDPEEHLGDLASTLGDLALSLAERPQTEPAVGARAAADEGVARARALLEFDADYYAPELARALDVRGSVESDLGDHEAALASLCEGLRVLMPCCSPGPTAPTSPTGSDRYAELIQELAADLERVRERSGLGAPAPLQAWLALRGA